MEVDIITNYTELYGEDLGRIMSKLDAEEKARNDADILHQKQITDKAISYKYINNKYKDDLYSLFSRISAELEVRGFENDKVVMSELVKEHLVNYCKIYIKD